MEVAKPRSNAWFLLPIFMGIVGGIIAYFVLRGDDQKKAKNCIYLGATLTAVWIAFNFGLNSLLGPEFMPGV